MRFNAALVMVGNKKRAHALRHLKKVISQNVKFGTTHVGFYKPGSHLPMRFRIDVISPSQNFLFLTG